MTEKELVRILKAFGNEKRIKILKALAKNEGLSVGELASEIRLSFKATSKHVARFSTLGILEGEGKGRSVVYSLSPSLTGKVKTLLKHILEA
jgi:DNA-binding transcriptional ArsR family regulator